MAGNNLIKRAYAESEYTPDKIQELIRCQRDPVYFIRNYVWLQHPTKGKMLFNLYDYQEELVKMIHQEKRVIALISRQMGKTQTISMFLLWYAMFHKDKTIVIASKNNSHAMEIMDRIRFAYEEVPHWLKAGCRYYNKHNIEFDNGSRIKSEATTEKTGRGLAISKLYLDELAFINPRIQTAMWRSLAPTLSTGGEAIISSTPNGDTDLFATLWRNANASEVDENGPDAITEIPAEEMAKKQDDGTPVTTFKPVFFPWSRHPDRGQAYLRQMQAELGPIGFRQEVLCEFISSDAMLIDSFKLSFLKARQPVSKNMGFRFWRTDEEIGGRNKTYLIGVDPGTGNGQDFTVIQVVEFPKMEQIAELRLNSVNIPLIYAKLKWLFKYLRKTGVQGGKADIVWSFERNGVGESLVAMIQNDEAPDGGVYLDGVDLYNENDKRLGCYTTGKTKLLSCMQMKNLVEKGPDIGLRINSDLLLFELQNFISKGGTYVAKQGTTDDAIMAMIIVMKVLNRVAGYDERARKIVYESVDPDSDVVGESDDQFGDEAVPFAIL